MNSALLLAYAVRPVLDPVSIGEKLLMMAIFLCAVMATLVLKFVPAQQSIPAARTFFGRLLEILRKFFEPRSLQGIIMSGVVYSVLFTGLGVLFCEVNEIHSLNARMLSIIFACGFVGSFPIFATCYLRVTSR